MCIFYLPVTAYSASALDCLCMLPKVSCVSYALDYLRNTTCCVRASDYKIDLLTFCALLFLTYQSLM